MLRGVHSKINFSLNLLRVDLRIFPVKDEIIAYHLQFFKKISDHPFFLNRFLKNSQYLSHSWLNSTRTVTWPCKLIEIKVIFRRIESTQRIQSFPGVVSPLQRADLCNWSSHRLDSDVLPHIPQKNGNRITSKASSWWPQWAYIADIRDPQANPCCHLSSL